MNTGTWIDNLDTNVIPYLYYPEWKYYYPAKNDLKISDSRLLVSYAKQAYRAIVKEAQIGFERKDPFIFQDAFVFKKIMDKSDLYSNILRFDFVKDIKGDYKLIEANADTPCAIPEAFYGNFKYYHDSMGEEIANRKLADVFIKECYDAKMKHGYNSVNIAFAASEEYVEDWYNTKYLYENFLRFNTHKDYHAYLVPLSKLSVYDDDKRCGVYVDDTMIDVLYRLHPIEMMIDDISEDGFPVGLKLIELHYNDLVKLINPPGSIFLQTKELFKYIEGLNFIPRTLNFAPYYDKPVIAKPIFGREGDGIKIFDNLTECKNALMDTSDYLIQEYIEQPTVKIETIDGATINAYITYSVFMLNGDVSVMYARADENKVCGVDALWVPCR